MVRPISISMALSACQGLLTIGVDTRWTVVPHCKGSTVIVEYIKFKTKELRILYSTAK